MGGRMKRKRYRNEQIENFKKEFSVCIEAKSSIVKC
jgi:hypothetical protein